MRMTAAVQMEHRPWVIRKPLEGTVLTKPVLQSGCTVCADQIASLSSTEPVASINADAQLIQACLRRDEQSFAQLVEKYQKLAARHLWHFTRDPLILEELVQDTFVEVYVSLHRFHLDAPFIPWLRTIATRVGYRYWRQCRRNRDRQAVLSAQPKPRIPEPDDTAEYVFYMLEQLNPKDRLVLTLQYFDGYDTREIADHTGWTQTMVKVRAFRARAKLRTLLEEQEEQSHENH